MTFTSVTRIIMCVYGKAAYEIFQKSDSFIFRLHILECSILCHGSFFGRDYILSSLYLTYHIHSLLICSELVHRVCNIIRKYGHFISYMAIVHTIFIYLFIFSFFFTNWLSFHSLLIASPCQSLLHSSRQSGTFNCKHECVLQFSSF